MAASAATPTRSNVSWINEAKKFLIALLFVGAR
jgi:hypothetical protein